MRLIKLFQRLLLIPLVIFFAISMVLAIMLNPLFWLLTGKSLCKLVFESRLFSIVEKFINETLP